MARFNFSRGANRSDASLIMKNHEPGWFNYVYEKAQHVPHIAAFGKQGCKVVAVVENDTGEDAQLFFGGDKGAILYAAVNKGHRRFRFDFDCEAKNGAISFYDETTVFGTRRQCSLSVPPKDLNKVVEMDHKTRMEFEVVKNTIMQENFTSQNVLFQDPGDAEKIIPSKPLVKTASIRQKNPSPPAPPPTADELKESSFDNPTDGEKEFAESPMTKADEIYGGRFSGGKALIIGVADYPKARKLPNAVINDAEDFAGLLLSPDYCAYSPENVRVRTEEDATADDIRDGLSWLSGRATEEDTAVIFFSGHGFRVSDVDGTTNYLIPYDGDVRKVPETAISGDELTRLLGGINAARLVVIFDCCYAGGTGETKDIEEDLQTSFKSGLAENYYNRLAEGEGRVIIASSKSDEKSRVVEGMRNSLFTHHLLEALRGKVRTSDDGLVRIVDLFSYVSDKVSEASKNKQNPLFKAGGTTNFPIALYKGGEKSGSENLKIPPPPVAEVDLRRAIEKYFNVDEMKFLLDKVNQILRQKGKTFEGELDWEQFEGNKAARIREIIRFLERRQCLQHLVAAAQEARPEVSAFRAELAEPN